MGHQLLKTGIYMFCLITLIGKSFSAMDVMAGELYSCLGIVLGAFATQNLSPKQNKNYK